jgi:bifunctional UDP-N-acetylglucosamine pyrophosphorylase/glucosamine-1-phosphate N-acetyltransferase
MMPLTADQPKPLIKIAGRPILEHILSGLQQAGIDEAIIVHGYLGQMIEDYFCDGSALGMRLRYCKQDPPDGTGGAVRQAAMLMGEDPFLLHWGDILVSPENYPAILATYHHAPSPPAAVLGLNWIDDPCAGAAVYTENGRVTSLVEKPTPGASTTNWNNAGVMVLGPLVWCYLRQITPSPRGEYEFTDVLHLMIHHQATVLAHPLTGLWSDVGTPEVVDELNAQVSGFRFRVSENQSDRSDKSDNLTPET